jgi:hypothetical protein
LTIYQRTPDGQWAAYSPESPLPRRLKIFLKAIDGKMTEEVYAKNLVAFGNVREVLKSLQESGLIEDVAAARARSAGTVSEWPTAMGASAITASVSPAISTPPAVFQQEPHSYQPTSKQALIEPSKAADISIAPERYLKLAIETMSGFVLVHLPGAAFNVLLEVEALQSVEQLIAMMDGYTQFVRVTGEAGIAHLAELNHIISLAGGHPVNLKTGVNV